MSTRVRTVNCFGGSYVYGYGDREEHLGWAGRLRRDFHQVNEVEGVEYAGLPAFYILGILGDTAVKLLGRIEQERVIRRGKAVLNILCIGVNDSAVRTDGSEIVSELEYARCLQKLGQNLTKDDNVQMLYVGLPSFDDRYTANFRNRNITYLKHRVRRYEAIAIDVYGEMGIRTIPLFSATDNKRYLTSMLDKDNLHPNTAGYRWIYEYIRPQVVKMWGTLDDSMPRN